MRAPDHASGTRRAGVGVTWRWEAAAPDGLRDLARRLGEGWSPGDAGLLKRGAGREVWRVETPDGPVLLKAFVVPPTRRLLHLVRPSRAAAEACAARAYTAAGLPTAAPIAVGERRKGALLTDSWYLGRFLPETTTLAAWMRGAAARGHTADVLDAARDALGVLGAMHRLPWRHRDLHAENLLRSADGGLVIIDLHSVRRVVAITRAIRLADLARLLFSMRDTLDLRGAPDWMDAYESTAGREGSGLAGDVPAAIDRFEEDYVRGRTARCLKRSTLFVGERRHGARVFRRRTYDPSWLDADVREHGKGLAEGRASVLGKADRTTVTRVSTGGVASTRVVKAYRALGPFSALRQRLGKGRARSAWIGARRLEVLDVPTPRALALAEHVDGSAWLVTEDLGDVPSLRAFARELERSPRPRDRADVTRHVGWLVGRLSRSGTRHDDLSTKNVLLVHAPPPAVRDVRDRPPGGAWHVVLIDLDNLAAVPRHDPAALVRMLTQLGDVPAWVTRADRRRFERAYEAAAGRPLPPDVVRAAREGSAARADRRETRTRPPPTPPARLGDTTT